MSVPIVYDHRGKVAVITGGSKGIGLGIAECLLAGGASVILASRDPVAGEAALSALGGTGRAHFIRTDVTSQQQCEALIDEVVSRFGGLDILVNNAGGNGKFLSIAEMTDIEWTRTLDLNLNSTFWCTRRALPQMKRKGWGRVLNISSIAALEPFAGSSNYATAKRGLHAFTRVLAKEEGSAGITANVICPGLVVTEMAKAQAGDAAAASGITEEQFYELYSQRAPIRRLVTPEEIGAVAGLLCSEPGGAISGQVLSMDGGVAEH